MSNTVSSKIRFWMSFMIKVSDVFDLNVNYLYLFFTIYSIVMYFSERKGWQKVWQVIGGGSYTLFHGAVSGLNCRWSNFSLKHVNMRKSLQHTITQSSLILHTLHQKTLISNLSLYLIGCIEIKLWRGTKEKELKNSVI